MKQSLFGRISEVLGEKTTKSVTHRIGWCSNCGWVHRRVERARCYVDSKQVIIKPLCVNCIRRERLIVCDICGSKKGENLYPVSVMRRRIGDDEIMCNLFLHLCADCRRLPHSVVLGRVNLPKNICDTCDERFKCFTEKGSEPVGSVEVESTLGKWRVKAHKRAPKYYGQYRTLHKKGR